MYGRLQGEETFSNENTGQRQTYVIVSVPGLNSWAQNVSNEPESQENKTTNTNSKRKHEDNDENMEIETTKRNCEENLPESSANTSTKPTLSSDFLLNCPLPDRPGKVCLVKLYDNYDWIKLNEIIEICGFLTIDPAIVVCTEAEGDEMDIETQVMNPPTSLIPRIHAVLAEKVIHNNPLLPKNLNTEIDNEFCNVYKDLHLVLTQILLGDQLAANFLICHLISRM